MKMCLALLTSKRISPVSRQEHRPKGSKEAKDLAKITFVERVRNLLAHALEPPSFLIFQFHIGPTTLVGCHWECVPESSHTKVLYFAQTSAHLFSGGIPRLTLETSEEGQVTSLRKSVARTWVINIR